MHPLLVKPRLRPGRHRGPPLVPPRYPEPSRCELGPSVTVCIASFTRYGTGDGEIVAVADRMLSDANDLVQGTEDTLKVRKVSKTWALMFSGDGNLFLPIVEAVQNRIGKPDEPPDLYQVQDAVAKVYAAKFDAEFTARYLARYGISGISTFRQSGLAEFGQERFEYICGEVDKFDLDITLLGYGFDKDSAPHIFEVGNPGAVINHDLLGYAAIGSGIYMAIAALRRKKMPYHRNAVVYRLLEAKFAAETASGVGHKGTVCFTMSPEGKDKSIGYGSLKAIKDVWEKLLELPEPQEALDIIRGILGKDDD